MSNERLTVQIPQASKRSLTTAKFRRRRRGLMRSVLSGLTSLALVGIGMPQFPQLAVAAPDAGATEEIDTSAPRAVVSATVDQVLAVLSDESLDLAQRQARVGDIANSNFDFETMSKLVMARNWRRLSDAQKLTFVQEFEELLSRSYGARLERWGDEKVEIFGERVEPRGDVTVKTRIIGGSFDGATIDYRLRKSMGGEWKAIDVIAEGVSLVSSYRSQFRDAMARGGPDSLLKQMKQKNLDSRERAQLSQTAGD